MKSEIVLIHGLNNNQEVFIPLKEALESKGFVVHLFSLVGHKNMSQNLSLTSSINHLVKQFRKLSPDKTYYCIGFSQGGLALQLLPAEVKKNIIKQVLLAPALCVHHAKVLEKLVRFIPKQIPFFSLAPKKLRQFNWLSVIYFDLLFNQINQFHSSDLSNIPTLVFIDPKDELVSYRELKELVKKSKHWNLITLNRPYLFLKHLGQHHVIFHPDYFSTKDWSKFISQITNFLN